MLMQIAHRHTGKTDTQGKQTQGKQRHTEKKTHTDTGTHTNWHKHTKNTNTQNTDTQKIQTHKLQHKTQTHETQTHTRNTDTQNTYTQKKTDTHKTQTHKQIFMDKKKFTLSRTSNVQDTTWQQIWLPWLANRILQRIWPVVEIRGSIRERFRYIGTPASMVQLGGDRRIWLDPTARTTFAWCPIEEACFPFVSDNATYRFKRWWVFLVVISLNEWQ